MRHPSLILLSHDHHHGLALALRCRKQALGQMKPAGPEGLKERAREFIDFYSNNLTPHFEAEEKVLFPSLGSFAPESHALIEELLREHEQMRRWVMCLQEEVNLAKMIHDLGDLLERHIRLEERELFPVFERAVSENEAERVKREIERILETRNPESEI